MLQFGKVLIMWNDTPQTPFFKTSERGNTKGFRIGRLIVIWYT